MPHRYPVPESWELIRSLQVCWKAEETLRNNRSAKLYSRNCSGQEELTGGKFYKFCSAERKPLIVPQGEGLWGYKLEQCCSSVSTGLGSYKNWECSETYIALGSAVTVLLSFTKAPVCNGLKIKPRKQNRSFTPRAWEPLQHKQAASPGKRKGRSRDEHCKGNQGAGWREVALENTMEEDQQWV